MKRGLDVTLFERAARLLQEHGTLPAEYRPHKLSGKYADYWECHLQPDWLLIWSQDNDRFVLLFIDTGTHADLF
jgi:mRNA interferase YafQ